MVLCSVAGGHNLCCCYAAICLIYFGAHYIVLDPSFIFAVNLGLVTLIFFETFYRIFSLLNIMKTSINSLTTSGVIPI